MARQLLRQTLMSRWLLVLVLTVAAATAWAQPGRATSTATPTATPTVTPTVTPAATSTARAQRAVVAGERSVAQLEARRRELAGRYAAELAAVDRIKRQRTSWRQQRELQDQLATANDTAKQLTAVTREHAAAASALASARRTLVRAIDAELAASPSPPRAAELATARAALVPQVPRRVARIVLPELEIDPLADPEELDEHAAVLRESEQQLLRQIAGLERQARELDAVALLRKQHDRAGELSRRDDDQPQRIASQGARVVRDSAPAPASDEGGSQEPGEGGSGGGFGSGGGPSFEAEASIVLSEIVDATTLETLARASRTGDPAQRALAARRARDAVQRRLQQLRSKRAELEALAKQRRR